MGRWRGCENSVPISVKIRSENSRLSVIRNSLLPLPIKCSCWQCSASIHWVGTSVILEICNWNQSFVQLPFLKCTAPFHSHPSYPLLENWSLTCNFLDSPLSTEWGRMCFVEWQMQLKCRSRNISASLHHLTHPRIAMSNVNKPK